MNFLKKNTGLLLRFDDIAPNMNWKMMNKCEKLFLNYNIKPVLGIIPKNEDNELLSFQFKENFWEKVKHWQSLGWEISIHGYNHKYSLDTRKKDYFKFGGKSEFYGNSYDKQKLKLKKSIEIFKKNNIKVRSFFAPNHTYDFNTFKALKANGIFKVIDGYGFFPYEKFGINFVPQLFYKNIILPFGIQSTQIHLNTWNDKDFEAFEFFIKKNHKKIIDYDYALSKTYNNLSTMFLRVISEYLLRFYRLFKFKS